MEVHSFDKALVRTFSQSPLTTNVVAAGRISLCRRQLVCHRLSTHGTRVLMLPYPGFNTLRVKPMVTGQKLNPGLLFKVNETNWTAIIRQLYTLCFELLTTKNHFRYFPNLLLQKPPLCDM